MNFTITQLEKQLAKIRRERTKGKFEDGAFGFKECKESIKFSLYIHRLEGMTIQKLYAELVQRALTDYRFNIRMIVACEELMEEGAE